MSETPVGAPGAGRGDRRRHHRQGQPRATPCWPPARRPAIDTPTLCYGPTIEPANACRVCVVELEGSRTLVPACSRKAEAGMVVHTDTERVDRSRKLVLELLGSSVDLSTTPSVERWIERYHADPSRFGDDAATVRVSR